MTVSLLDGAQLFAVDPDEVDPGERIGFLHADKAAALGRLMAVDGQRDPIKVVRSRKGAERPWRLVTGMHRLQGAALEGIRVWAIEVSGRPEDLADLEASENLHRRPLAPIERAKFTAALAQSARERVARERGDLKQQQLAVRTRWARVRAGERTPAEALAEEVEDTQCHHGTAYGWEESVGDALGMSRRTIHRDLELFRLVIEPFPELAEPLSRHPVVGENPAQLRAIAAIRDEAKRREAIEWLLVDPELSAEGARVQAGVDAGEGPAPAAWQKFYNQIEGGWSRLDLEAKRRFLPSMRAMLTTPDLERRMLELLGARPGAAELAADRIGEVAAGLDAAFKVLVQLVDGEPVEDEALQDACADAQQALSAARAWSREADDAR